MDICSNGLSVCLKQFAAESESSRPRFNMTQVRMNDMAESRTSSKLASRAGVCRGESRRSTCEGCDRSQRRTLNRQALHSKKCPAPFAFLNADRPNDQRSGRFPKWLCESFIRRTGAVRTQRKKAYPLAEKHPFCKTKHGRFVKGQEKPYALAESTIFTCRRVRRRHMAQH